MDITWKRKWIFWLLLAVMLLFLPGKTFAAEKESRGFIHLSYGF